MDFIRLILPQLVGLAIWLIILWFVALRFKNEMRKISVPVAKFITIITMIIFVVWIINIASVNEVPRAVIDRSNPEMSRDRFEDRVNKNAALPKQIDTTKIINNNK